MSRESDLEQLRDQASTAYRQGRQTFVARFRLGVWGTPSQGEVSAWMDSLDAVEAAGWVLDRWDACSDTSGGLNAFPVFRRRDEWTPQDRS